MAIFDLNLFKEIPQKDKDLMNGFIREIQKLFSKNNVFYMIPESINHICAIFYYTMDKWDPEYIGTNHVYQMMDIVLQQTMVRLVHIAKLLQNLLGYIDGNSKYINYHYS